MSVLAPVPGDPASIRLLAASLTGAAERFGATTTALTGLCRGAVWDGPAGTAFTERVGRVPTLLDAAAIRYAACSAALLTLADSLADAQRVTATAIETDDRCRRDHLRLEERGIELISCGRDESDPELVAIRTAQQRVVGEQLEAQAAHRRAVADHLAVDRACAARLRHAAADSIADSRTYRLLRLGSGDSRLSEGLVVPGMLLPPLGAVTGTANALSDGLLRLFYDEGSWSEVVAGGALAGLGGAGRLLRRGSVLGATLVGSQSASGPTRRAIVESHHTLGARMRIAGREELGEQARARLNRFVDPTIRGLPGSGAVPSRGTSTALVGLPPTAGGAAGRALGPRLKSAAMEQVNTRFLDSWRMASAGGSATRRMYVAGVTLEGASKGARPIVRRDEEAPVRQ